MTTTTLDTLSAQYARALQTHKIANGKAAATTLELCRVVLRARTELARTDYIYFLRKHDLGGSGEKASRLQKMLKVAAAYDVLHPHVAALPASLTSLSHIARIHDTDALTGYVASGSVHPLMTVTESANLMVSTNRPKRGTATPGPKPKEKPLGQRDYSVKLVFFNAVFTPAKGQALLKSLRAYMAKHGAALGLAEIVLSSDLDLALLEAERQTAA